MSHTNRVVHTHTKKRFDGVRLRSARSPLEAVRPYVVTARNPRQSAPGRDEAANAARIRLAPQASTGTDPEVRRWIPLVLPLLGLFLCVMVALIWWATL